MDGSGNLFGTSWGGGVDGEGTVFEIVKGSNTLTVLASFDGGNGAHPYGSLILDRSGNLFGATSVGGDSNNGTIFQIASGSNTITPLASLNGANGSYTAASLVMDSTGNLYGVSTGGGANTNGSVFELGNGANTITTLASFDGSNGSYPNGALVLDSEGNLYGTTEIGGDNGNGTVFEIAKGSNAIRTLASFNGNNGANPYAGMAFDAAGNLFGTAWAGGDNGDGTVFEVVKGSSTIATLASFSGSDGSNPVGGVVIDSSGNLYGTTSKGGANGVGSVFEYSPTASSDSPGVTGAQLVKIMPVLGITMATQLAPALNAALAEFGINTKVREACFLSQIAAESIQLTDWDEQISAISGPNYINYTTFSPIKKDVVRAKSFGMTLANDGLLYHGRGPIQLTWLTTYTQASRYLFPADPLLLVNSPTLVSDTTQPQYGFRTAGWFWTRAKSKNLNIIADTLNPAKSASVQQVNKQLTKIVTGGLNATTVTTRLKFLKRALADLS